ncbi:uncharacterized protein [Argopecten irradians]|uniref:uncharacterized protein isoform X2 n=1 Tax=Argopecten irradians TaxID=31199 RepID=UPI00371DA100
MDTYTQVEQFLKHPFDPQHGVSTVSKWTPKDSTRSRTDGNPQMDNVDKEIVLGEDFYFSTTAYKNTIGHLVPSESGPEGLSKATIGQIMDGRGKDILVKRAEARDIMLPGDGLGMAFYRHGESGIEPYIVSDIITRDSSNPFQLSGVRYNVDQYRNLEPLLHLNMYDLRMPPMGNHYQVKGYLGVSKTDT